MLGAGAKVLVVAGAAGVASVGRGQGLPHARHSWFQQTHGGADIHTAAHETAHAGADGYS